MKNIFLYLFLFPTIIKLEAKPQQTSSNTEIITSNTENTPPILKCGSSKIDIEIPKSFLIKHNILIKDSSELFFANHKDCFAVNDGESYRLQIFAPFDSCGMKIEHGNDDYVYSNEVVFESNNRNTKFSVFEFRCVYEDKYLVSSGPVTPSRRTLQFSSGEGKFEVSMDMYRGPSFSFMDKHAENPVVKLNEPIYVDLEFTSNLGFGQPGYDDLVTTVKTCFATSSPDHATDHNKYHNLISGMCVSPNDDSVKILENGESENARFKFNMFKWKGVVSYIYLHCEVHLCNSTVEICRSEREMCYNHDRKRKRRQVSQVNEKYTIQADMGEYPGVNGEPILDLKHSNDRYYDYSQDYNNNNQNENFFNLPEPNQMTDFITRGPIVISDIDFEDRVIGSGQINSTMLEENYQFLSKKNGNVEFDLQNTSDKLLRAYIFSSIAIVICVIAVILTLILAVNRRKEELDKMADIDHVFQINEELKKYVINRNNKQKSNNEKSNIRRSIDSDGTNNSNFTTESSILADLTFIDRPNKVLPAITALPLPPTPELSRVNLPPILGSPSTMMSTLKNVHSFDSSHSSGLSKDEDGVVKNTVQYQMSNGSSVLPPRTMPLLGPCYSNNTMLSVNSTNTTLQKAQSSRLAGQQAPKTHHHHQKPFKEIGRSLTAVNPVRTSNHAQLINKQNKSSHNSQQRTNFNLGKSSGVRVLKHSQSAISNNNVM